MPSPAQQIEYPLPASPRHRVGRSRESVPSGHHRRRRRWSGPRLTGLGWNDLPRGECRLHLQTCCVVARIVVGWMEHGEA